MPLDHILDALSWLAYCFAGYMACLVIVSVWRGRRPKHAERWMKFVDRLGQWRQKLKDKGRAHSMAMSIVFSLCCLGLLAGASIRSRSNIVTQHNVAVYRQLDNGDWLMSSDEDPSLVFRPCQADQDAGVDVNGLLHSGIGYIADRAMWEERGTCKSILRADLGFWFRDEHNNFTYRRIR